MEISLSLTSISSNTLTYVNTCTQPSHQNVTKLVSDYKSYDIPVGALNIDSEWATAFNNFEVDTEKYPAFEDMVADFHEQDVRVILWATSMVAKESIDNASLFPLSPLPSPLSHSFHSLEITYCVHIALLRSSGKH